MYLRLQILVWSPTVKPVGPAALLLLLLLLLYYHHHHRRRRRHRHLLYEGYLYLYP